VDYERAKREAMVNYQLIVFICGIAIA